MRRNQLSSIVPICFITVVFFWIMGSGANDTTLTSEISDGKAEFRRGAERLKQKNLYPIGRKNFCSCFRIKPTVITAVVRDSHLNLMGWKRFQQIIGISLSCHSNCIFINPVCSYAHYPPEPAGPEFEVLVETVY